ncbi:sigma-70 family RNA polymerase sigma factor [Streptomyces sp. NPDC096057]|uniref:sigma-70 family RNA polymerase sigma factor n=1 Tax=Streptomyces sp. NPDC096057 TaxID=3155543 RepID=UPI003325AB81
MNDGPTAAYARIYEEQQPRLVAYARSLTRDTWVAEDLVAEAHFRVWRRLSAGHEIDNVPAYLMTTVKHLATAAGTAARETPRDPQADERVGAVPAHVHGGDPAEQVSSTDLLVRVLEQLPERWVKALWLAEAEGLPLAAIGPQLGTREGATAVLLHRAREGMRQAFLREQTGAPDDPACRVHWARMPAYVRGGATERQSERLLGHVDACDDCRARLAALMRANDRLPALVAPALLVFVLGGAGKFLLAFGAGSAAAGSAAAGHGGGLLHGVRHAAVGASKAQLAAAVGTAVAGAVAVCVLLGGTGTTEVPVAKSPATEVPVAQAPVASEPRPTSPSKTPGERDASTPPAADGSVSAVPPAALEADAGESTVTPAAGDGVTPAPTAPVDPTPRPPVEPTPPPEPKPLPSPPVVPEPTPPPKPTEPTPAPPKSGDPKPKPEPTPTDPATGGDGDGHEGGDGGGDGGGHGDGSPRGPVKESPNPVVPEPEPSTPSPDQPCAQASESGRPSA